MSQKRIIVTVVLPNMPADNEAGGSEFGAAAKWQGQGTTGPRSDSVADSQLSLYYF